MSKIVSWDTLKHKIEDLHAQGKKVAITNGCFDILHVGHVRYLKEAKKQGDILVLALNSDKSVQAIKGLQRPIVPQEERADLLAALESVDYVTIFEEPTPAELIDYIQPDILVKGGDWKEDQLAGRETVKKRGGHVAIIPIVPGASTTNIIDKIISVYGSDPER
jgi:D-beta-D-heptose 7-phosphate kinase/D-beta-D-heptose 1-phosphate adenosyltransferase